MAEYTKEIYLPSKGKLNEDNEAYAGPIVIDMMGFKQEKTIFGSMADSTFDKVMNELILTEGIDINALSTYDKTYLLVQERILSYGDDYILTDICPNCGEKQSFKIKLSEVPVTYLPDDFVEPYLVKLPFSGEEVGLRLLRAKDISDIDKKVKEMKERFRIKPNEIRYLELKLKSIVSVDGEILKYDDKKDFIESLKGLDSAYIEDRLNKLKYGYPDSVEVTCDVCGEKFETPLVINSEFFRPSFD